MRVGTRKPSVFIAAVGLPVLVAFVPPAGALAQPSTTRRPRACSDGIDNDHDGLVDLATGAGVLIG